MATIVEELAEFCAGVQVADLPADTVDRIKLLTVDSLGVSQFVAARTPWGRAARSYAARAGGAGDADGTGGADGAGGPGRPAQVLGSPIRSTPAAAALANGTMALGFEYEDMHTEGTGHPFSIVFPAALAAAEAAGADTRGLLAALVAGYEVGVRVSLAMTRQERWTRRGLYPITIFGVFGAAAAACRAMSLDAERTAHALGVAGTHAFGTMQATKEGTTARRLHGGRAAETGVTAALLVTEGFTGPHGILEGEFGVYASFGTGTHRFDRITDGLGTRWATDGTWLKYYPCNGLFQAPIDALLSLMDGHRLRPEDVEKVRVTIPLATRLHGRPSAVTPVNAQFSLHYCMALALLRGRPTAEMFLRVGEPDVVAAMDRIVVTLDPEFSHEFDDSSRPGRVELVLADGRTLADEVVHPRGHPANPMGWDEVQSKVHTLLDGVVGPARVDALVTRVRTLDTPTPIPSLTA